MSRQAWRRLVSVALAVLVAAVAISAWRGRAFLAPAALLTLLQGTAWAPVLFLALHILASLAFVPRTMLGLVAGLAFGLWWGLVWALCGGMLGAWAGFALARAVGHAFQPFSLDGRVAALLDRVERGGWRAVWVIRLLPLPHTPINFAFGLTKLGWLPYTIGSFLGIVPSTVMAVGIGAAGEQALGGSGWLLPSVIGLAGLALSVVLPRVVPQHRRPGQIG